MNIFQPTMKVSKISELRDLKTEMADLDSEEYYQYLSGSVL